MTSEGQLAGEFIKDEILLGFLQSKAFKDRYNKHIRALALTGTDFEEITNTVKKLRDKLPNMDAYCRVSIKSEVVKDGWHDVILLSADKDSVTIHDPSSTVGGAYRTIPKQEFIQRWGETLMSGTLILAA